VEVDRVAAAPEGVHLTRAEPSVAVPCQRDDELVLAWRELVARALRPPDALVRRPVTSACRAEAGLKHPQVARREIEETHEHVGLVLVDREVEQVRADEIAALG